MEDKIILYQNEDNNVFVNVYYQDETFWLTQKAMAELFDVDRTSISRHLKNIFIEGELDEKVVSAFFAHTTPHGAIKGKTQTSETKFYNLDAIISVGYRVNSKKATQFRKWATKILKEYVIKGFVLNDDMLKNGKPFGQDYFDELLEHIREIRASERRFYQKITDIYAQCSYDYDKEAKETQTFFKTVQNKLLFAISGKTAPELLRSRIDCNKANMGLTSWKNAPEGKILQSDVLVSKNVLSEEELSELNHIVSMYLDYAENQARRNVLMSMKDWKDKLDAFLKFNEYDILQNAGTVKREVAEQLVKEEFKKYRVIQDKNFRSDFDKETKKLLK